MTSAPSDPPSPPGIGSNAPVSKERGRLFAALVAAAFSAAFLLPLPAYSADARILPIAIGGPTAVLALLNLAREVNRWRRRTSEKAPPKSDPHTPTISVWTAGFYILGFGAAIGFLGYIWGSVVAIVLFMRIYGKESYRLAVIYAVVLSGVVYLVFIAGFGIDYYPGLIFGS